MIKIATPVSHLFFEKGNSQKIIHESDCLECRERTKELTFERQNLFHIDIDITHPWDEQKKEYIASLLSNKPQLELATFQATCNCSAPTLNDFMYESGGQSYSEEEMLGFGKINIEWLKQHFPNLSFGMENNNYYPSKAYNIVAEAEFIYRVVVENDIYFLFDIAHAQVTCKNKNISYFDYCQKLPLERVIQLHICKPDLGGEIARDAHDSPDREMFMEVSRLLKQYSSVQYLTVEYYKDVDELVRSLKTLKKVINEVVNV